MEFIGRHFTLSKMLIAHGKKTSFELVQSIKHSNYPKSSLFLEKNVSSVANTQLAGEVSPCLLPLFFSGNRKKCPNLRGYPDFVYL